jgi:cytoskeletal protein CcmA (bactofilin family)
VSLFGSKRDGERNDARENAHQTGGEAARATRGAAPQASGASRPQTPFESQKTPRGGGESMANSGKSISIKGDLTGNEDISIEGTVDGKVDLPDGQLTIGANGTVKGEILAKGVIVIGKVTGNVQGSERVEVQATGIVEGDVVAPKLVVAEGAIVNGSIKMGTQSSASARPPAPQENVQKAV